MLKAILAAAALVLSYAAILVFAGHGVGPAALVLVAVHASEYLFALVLGWLGIAALFLAAVLARTRVGPTLLTSGAGFLVLSCAGWLWASERRGVTLATSGPFLLLAGWVLVRRGRFGGASILRENRTESEA